jgi:hypothetical protein
MRKLDLRILHSFNGDVTLGFKTSTTNKIQLVQAAQQEGMSLSKYVNHIITSYPSKLRRLEEDNIVLSKKVSSFELPELITLFGQVKGHKAFLKDSGGFEKHILINSIYDLQEVLVKSFKIN